MMAAVRSFEELAVQALGNKWVRRLAVQNGRHSIIKDAKKYTEELDLQLWLNFPNPTAVANGKEVEAKKVKQAIYKARQHDLATVSEERWQGKLIQNRWDDEKVCVAFFMEECPNQPPFHRWSTRTLPTAVTYQGLLQQKNQITSN